jgi:hypothetical protein
LISDKRQKFNQLIRVYKCIRVQIHIDQLESNIVSYQYAHQQSMINVIFLHVFLCEASKHTFSYDFLYHLCISFIFSMDYLQGNSLLFMLDAFNHDNDSIEENREKQKK